MREESGMLVLSLIIAVTTLLFGWIMGIGVGTEKGTLSTYEEHKDVLCTKPDLTVDQRYKLRHVCNFK